MLPKNLLFVIRHTPYGHFPGKEVIDALLACSAYGQNIALLFLNDGVFHLKSHQQAAKIEQKSIEKMLAALEIYDVNEIYACEESISLRSIKFDNPDQQITLLNRPKINALMLKQDKLLSF